MKVLAIIDAQKDFINGSMGVGLDKWNPAKAEILKLIETENYDGFIYTQDWHPENHCSFKEQNGPWPAHCVANSEGAKIEFDLSGMQGSLTTKIIRKGRDENKEEYGVDLLKAPTDGMDYGKEKQHLIDEVHIVGLCFDYCVASCAKMTKEAHPEIKVIIKKEGTVAIDPNAVPDVGEAIVE